MRRQKWIRTREREIIIKKEISGGVYHDAHMAGCERPEMQERVIYAACMLLHLQDGAEM